MWFAPNALTLIGFLLLVLEYVVLTWYDCNFYASSDNYPQYTPIPNWVWLLCTLCMFLAHTLDGTDGKQARRTGSSSPLGELFDHGLDSWVTLFMPLGMYNVFGRGDYGVTPERAFYVFAGVMFVFVVSHWEKYNTGILFLPWGYDVSQFAMAMVYIVTFFYGCGIWKFTLPFVNIEAGLMFEIIMHFSTVAVSIPMTLWNVYVAYRDGTGHNLSFYESIRGLLPSTLLFTLFAVWMHKSSYGIVSHAPRLFYSAMGTAFSNSTCRLIVNCMSYTRCEAFNWLLWPLFGIVGAVLTFNLGVVELYLLWAYAIFVLVAHLHYATCVVQQLADHLNIYVFSVEKRPKRA